MNNKCDKIKREKVEDMKPSACCYCPMTSKRRYNICIHEERKHERAFSCPYCIYESKDSSNMRRHIRGLHSEDRYKCQICLAEFKWVSGLKKHLQRHSQNYHSQMMIES